MTRETRIGLLIGLGFVVVFGLVLSELTTPQSSAVTPASDEINSTYRHTYVIDETPGASGERIVRISRSGRPGATPAPRRRTTTPAPAPRRRIAPPVHAAQVRRAPAARIARYAVQRGDTLIGIARKVYGPDHERQYRRIFQANRGILSDESALSPGQVLVIPPLSDNSPAPRRTAVAPAETRQPPRHAGTNLREVPRPVAAAITRRPNEPNERVYVVKRGDSLSEIAYVFYSDDSRRSVMKIYDANEAKLRGMAQLPPGMTLRIPG